MTVGDRVRLNATGIKYLGYPTAKAMRWGTVVGRSRIASSSHLWILWDGLKTRQPYLVEFLELAE